MTHRAVALLLTGAAGLAFAACGGTSEDEEVAAALAEDLRADTAFTDDLSADEARCVGDELVAGLGADAAAAVGPDPGDDDASLALSQLDEDEVRAIGTAMETCVADLDSIVVDLVADGILAEPDEDFPTTEEQARCIGETVADELAFDELLSIGWRVDDGGIGDLPRDQAETVAMAFTECVDVRSILLEQVRATGAEDEVVDCLDEHITDADIEELFIEAFRGGTADAETAFAPAIDACTGNVRG